MTALPSTVDAAKAHPPSRAATVLNSTRSIGPPEVFVIVGVEFDREPREP